MTNGVIELLRYDKVVESLARRTRHLLVGNGFSIGCDPIFRYESLYDAAVRAGLSLKAQAVFERLGTNNFEGVMRLLEDADWVAREYDLLTDAGSAMLDDVDVVKAALVEAIATSHLEHTGRVSDDKKDSCGRFLRPFQNVFTTNYDLLLYWVVMHVGDEPRFDDGFRADHDDPDLPHLVFDGAIGRERGMLYLHGALHLYVTAGEVRKQSWSRDPDQRRLTELVRDGLEQGEYPLFVAEGTSAKKVEQIRTNGYLFYCLDKFSRIQAPLVTYGYSFGDSDRHIANAIADNLALRQIFVGLHGDPLDEEAQTVRAGVRALEDRRNEMCRRFERDAPLEVAYFDSRSANVWDMQSTT